MKKVIRNIVARTYKPLLERYLSKTRLYRYGDILLEIPPEVFHPGFFFSTQFLLETIKEFSLKGKCLLEPGCGSGLISIYAAKRGAKVTASDINPIAVKKLKQNADRNNVDVEIIHSDLFKNIPARCYDFVVINPPYYKKQPVTMKDYAWHCGENGEYFQNLFEGIGDYINTDSVVLVVMFEGCDIEMVKRYAHEYSYDLKCIRSQSNILERNFIYRLEILK